VAELADAHDLGSCGATRGGSSPLIRTSTIKDLWFIIFNSIRKNMHETLNEEEEVKVSSDRSFGVVFTIVFLALGVWLVSGGRSWGWICLAIAAILFVITLVRPSILSLLNRAWFNFGLLLSRVVNPIILGVVFFLVVTPIAFIRRLLGKDSLHLKANPDLESYWIDRIPAGPKLNSMTKQF
jgi:hypothetical protein